MTFASTALAMVAVLFGVGAPIALLVLPRRRRVHWPVVAPLGGVAWASLVGWVAIAVGMRISVGLAWLTVGGAVGLGVVVLLRDRGRVIRLVAGGLRRHAGVLILAIAALLALARPMTEARLGLTSLSLGSCDAPDYAAGATLMRDVAPGDRSGFNGQTETVALRSVDTFHGHWLRLNHFAPAAVLAWFSSLFDLPMFKLTTALGIALHGAAVPPVFWLARAGLRVGTIGSLGVAASWAFGAPAVYGVAQAALGQVMVVPAVALLTWTGLRAFAEGGTWRGALRWAPLAAAGFVVLIAAYTFALVFVLAPLAAGLLWLAWRSHRWAGLGRAAASGLLALAGASLVLAERMAGLADRFAQFEAIDFGWFIPVFTPERWLGWFGDARLGAGAAAVGVAVLVAAVAVWSFHLVRCGRRDLRRIGLALAWIATVAGGYTVLATKGAREGSNELYNAYKVFALLQPLVLAAVAVPLRIGRPSPRWARPAVVAVAAGLAGVHWAGAAPLREALRQPALWVDRPLAALGTIAARDDVASINMLLEPMWARLWANSLLLNKRQYFRTETYEGRRATELRGDWDLRDGLLGVRAGAADTLVLAGGYHLVRRAGPAWCGIELGSGWHPPEGGGHGRWAWSPGEGTLRFENPHGRALRATIGLGLQGLGARTATIAQDGRDRPLWSGAIGPERIAIEIRDLVLPPGGTVLRIQSPEPAAIPPGDGRPLSFALHDLVASFEAGEGQP